MSLAIRALVTPALVKFLLAGTAACSLCFLAAGALLAIPPVRRVVSPLFFSAHVENSAYPEEKHLVPIADAEFEAFMKSLPEA